MLVLEDIWSEELSKQKLKKFDETLRSLRRQFRRLLVEIKKSKNPTELTDLSRDDSITPEKANRSNGWLQDASNSASECGNIIVEASMKANNNPTGKEISISSQMPEKSDNILPEDEIPEILSVDFNSDSEKSLLDQFERSKSSLNSSDNQLQKSPVFCKKRFKAKKSQSPRVDISCKKNAAKSIKGELVTGYQKSGYKDVKPLSDNNKSLFSSFKEKENLVSPQPKSCSKLGITKLYNVDTKLSSNGNKLKQTKLVFTAEAEKTDISDTTNFSNQATNGTIDSIFDLSLFQSDRHIETMDIDMKDSSPKTKTTNTVNSSSWPAESQVADADDFIESSPIVQNRALKSTKHINVSRKNFKIPKSPKKNKIEFSKVITSKSDTSVFKPQASSTQNFSLKNEDECNTGMIIDSNSDSDTDFNEENVSKEQIPEGNKSTLADDWKKSSPTNQKSDKSLEVHHSQGSQTKATETAFDDETFFSPGEYQNVTCFEENAKPSTSGKTSTVSSRVKRVLMSSFDRIPEKKKRSPEYAYVESVKKKSERAQMTGWACYDCKKYYENLSLSEKDLKECMKKCSRHKAKYDPEYHTPPDFWNPGFPDTFAPTFPGLENN